MKIPFNNDWLFTKSFDDGFDTAVLVRIPHTACEIPYNYADCEAYQMLCGYKKSFTAPSEWLGKRIFIKFDGAAHDAAVFCNGVEVCRHSCGYTAFEVELTDYIEFNAENTVCVKLDTRESLNIPPFGFVIDYLCYGGIYREVSLIVKEKDIISDVFIENTGLDEITVRLETDGNVESNDIVNEIIDADGKTVSQYKGAEFTARLKNAHLWSVDDPYLYTLRTRIIRNNEITDEECRRFGFRTAKFENDGFYLNGKKLKLRGINRHQSYAYVGYAMPKSMQRFDAEILKYELGVNAVRTSHYPQSQHFIDRCDELGLLIFTEIPGWQHIGDEIWKKQAVINTEEMVKQYMHHPSIILWGVRINESQDDDALYTETNNTAHRLDRSRQTSGVRYIEKSSLLEDVYAYNDFSHSGQNNGLRKKTKVTSDKSKPYLVSECNGHMYPTKPFDDEEHRLSHALRHAKVIDAMYAENDICGIFPWCMFDYNTHRDFGSGDGTCYHGVLDMFRNPKLAASVFASQSENIPCCTVSSSMDIGEHPAGDLGNVYVFTNADYIKLYKNGVFVRDFYPSKKLYPAMPHPPVVIDDFVGTMLETQDGYSHKTAEQIKQCLKAIAKYGPSALPLKYLLKFGKLMLFKGLKYSDGVELYGKYVSNWGGEATMWRFDAVKDGEIIKSCTKKPGQKVHLEIKPSSHTLIESETYDVAEIRITALDEFNEPAVYYQEPIKIKCSDNIEIIGPDTVSFKGGSVGVYVKTKGVSGKAWIDINGEITEFNIE